MRSFLNLVFILSFTTHAIAQVEALPETRSVKIGQAFMYERVGERAYIPTILALEESFNITKGGWLQVYFTGKLNPTFIRTGEGTKFRPEAGMQVGLRAGWTKGQNTFYGDISSGPHVISGDLGIQYPGLLFSDNFSIGWMRPLNDKLMISMETRFRHLSNAGLWEPNYGIDNWLLVGGLHWRK